MRILTFKGIYSYKKENEFSGFICFCHFESKDKTDTLKKAVKELKECWNNLDIIIVPFAHLSEDAMKKELANNMFIKFQEIIKQESSRQPKIAPFGVVKELHLDILADDTNIKFFHF